MNSKNWDDIRFVLAVANEGSFLAAAKSLGVTHATVMRRVDAFERRTGQAVFQKTTSGCNVLPQASRIIEAARSVEGAVLSVETTILGAQADIEGNVRVATTDSICQSLMPGVIGNVTARYPKVTFSLLSSNVHHDLEHLIADIAVRPVQRLQEGLVGTIAGDLRFGLFGTHSDHEKWIGMAGPLQHSAAALWMAKHVENDKIVHTTDSFLVAQKMASAGLGQAILPLFIGECDDRLVRMDLSGGEICFPVWVATLPELTASIRFRTIRDAIAEELGKQLAKF